METHPADTLLRVQTTPPYLLILDFQGNHDASLLARLQLYRALVRRENPKIAVVCALILLRSFTGHRELTGTVRPILSCATKSFGYGSFLLKFS